MLPLRLPLQRHEAKDGQYGHVALQPLALAQAPTSCARSTRVMLTKTTFLRSNRTHG
jgi:hypothetical protein